MNPRTDKGGLELADCHRFPTYTQVNQRDWCGEHRPNPEVPEVPPRPTQIIERKTTTCDHLLSFGWKCRLDYGHHGPHSFIRGRG